MENVNISKLLSGEHKLVNRKLYIVDKNGVFQSCIRLDIHESVHQRYYYYNRNLYYDYSEFRTFGDIYSCVTSDIFEKGERIYTFHVDDIEFYTKRDNRLIHPDELVSNFSSGEVYVKFNACTRHEYCRLNYWD